PSFAQTVLLATTLSFQFLEANSVVVFAVNYIQNRFIAAEFCTEIARIFAILNVKTVAEFGKAIESLRNEPSTGTAEIEYFEAIVKNWDEFIEGIEKTLVEKVGPSTANTDEDVFPELGIESKTISRYVKGSAFDMVLVVVVRSFTSSFVTNHIVELCNKISEFRKLNCDVCLLTRGPPVGVRGGSYIKLIGVPFRKSYDDNEALAELKCHRCSAMDLVGWNALVQLVEASFVHEVYIAILARTTGLVFMTATGIDWFVVNNN
uniref:UDP-glucose:Glycoprotein Glucosyltransferase n=1 Tax=Angiostrongylus cantonensis TaxID=6313 RepID=A0A0K0D3S4_ANGCA